MKCNCVNKQMNSEPFHKGKKAKRTNVNRPDANAA